MNRLKTFLTALTCLAAVSAAYALPENFEARLKEANSTIRDNAPAKVWSDAYPIGNGRFGAMVFGGVREERLQLNDITVWSGGKDDPWKKDAWQHLPEIREAIDQKDWRKADNLVNRYMTEKGGYFPSYQTLGDLKIKFDIPEDAKIENYSRKLDLKTAVETVTFKADGVTYTREYNTPSLMILTSSVDKSTIVLDNDPPALPLII